MLPDINLTSHRQFKIRNFQEDKTATLSANPGLRYDGKIDECFRFSGNFYLTAPNGVLIESFGIIILIPKMYPNAFPVVVSVDNKIEKTDEFHISKDGEMCVEHTYIANKLANAGLRLYDFIQYYLPKYFSWILLKQNRITGNLQEWAHRDKGTIQVYETLLGTSDKGMIKQFLERYLNAAKIRRNDKCYCGNNRKLKVCHQQAAHFLKSTSQKIIENDLALFS